MENVKWMREAQHAICVAMEHGMAPWTHDGVPYVVYPDGRAMKFGLESERDEALRAGAPTLFRTEVAAPERLRHLLSLLENGVVTEFLIGMYVQEADAKGELAKEVSTALIHYFGATEECRVPKTRLRNLDGSYGREIGLEMQDWKIIQALGLG